MNYKFKKYLHFVIGMGILAFGLYNIHSRCHISEGGVLGATLLIQYWFHISPSISSFIIDTTVFLIGTFVLGTKFLKDSLIATSIYSLWYLLFEFTGPLFPDLSSQPLLAAIIGALFVGVGVGLILVFEGAPGADDALALIFLKKFEVPVETTYIISDMTVLLLSLTYIPFNQIMYSLLSVIISGQIIGLFKKYYKV